MKLGIECSGHRRALQVANLLLLSSSSLQSDSSDSPSFSPRDKEKTRYQRIAGKVHFGNGGDGIDITLNCLQK
jgi:hypothetical protein